MPLSKKPKTTTKMKILEKKQDVLDFWNTLSIMFLDCQKKQFLRVFFGCFLTKECPILTVLKQMILDESKQSNGIKPQKSTFLMIFCNFLSHKKNSVGKCLQKLVISFTWNIKKNLSAHQSSSFYLKLSHMDKAYE